jgi:Zn-dependent protease
MKLNNLLLISKSIIISYQHIWIVAIILLIISFWKNEIQLFIVLSTFGLYTGILIHEMAHITVAKYYHKSEFITISYKDNHLNISYPFHPLHSILISASGPIINIIIAIMVWIITQNIFNIFVIIHILLGIGNFLPPSNDGKEIFKGVSVLLCSKRSTQ